MPSFAREPNMNTYPTSLSIIRLMPKVRSADVEEMRTRPPGINVYFSTLPDWDTSLGATELGFTNLSLFRYIILIIRERFDVVHLPEPMWWRWLFLIYITIVIVRVSDIVRNHHTRIVCYAIDNSIRTHNLSVKIRRVAISSVAALAYRNFDRVAFGSSGAMKTYEAFPFPKYTAKPITREVTYLREHCTCEPNEIDNNLVLFVGALIPTKGISELLAAWPNVKLLCPTARLAIAGSGQLESAVQRAAKEDPSIMHLGKLDRSELCVMYRKANTVVLFSQPAKRGWVEQIGLSLVEGASHNCKIVCSDETGIADWVNRQAPMGIVVKYDATPLELASAIAGTMNSSLDSKRVYSLPNLGGSARADQFLYFE